MRLSEFLASTVVVLPLTRNHKMGSFPDAERGVQMLGGLEQWPMSTIPSFSLSFPLPPDPYTVTHPAQFRTQVRGHVLKKGFPDPFSPQFGFGSFSLCFHMLGLYHVSSARL